MAAQVDLDPSIDVLSLLTQHASSLTDITYTSSDNNPVSDLLSCANIHFSSAPSTPIPRGAKTRAVRSRNSPVLALDSLEVPSSSNASDDFLALDALIFLLQTQDEAVGLYAVKATRERVARVDTLDRGTLLDFLLGKSKDCEVVLSQSDCQARLAKRTQLEAAGQSIAPATEATTATDDQGPTEAPSTAELTSTSALDTSATSLHPLLAAGKRPYVPSKQDAAFVKRLRTSEVILRDRAWAFRCQKATISSDQDYDDDDDEYESGIVAERANSGTTSASAAPSTTNINGSVPSTSTASSRDADFTLLRRSVQGRIADLKRGGNGSGSATTSASSSSSSKPAPSATTQSTLGRSQRHRRLDPIIILPSSPSSLLTLANIKSFLEEGKFIPPSSATTLAPTGGSNEVVIINRPKGGRFLAIDSLDALNRLGASRDGVSNDPWRRVACIITTGQKWQFKGYRWEEGRELFRNGE